jgi:hypothetical protein
MNGQDLQGILAASEGDFVWIGLIPLEAATVLGALLAPRAIDENTAHRFGGCRKEVTAAAEVLRPVDYQPEVRFVHQCGGLERLSWPFLSQFLRRQFAKLVIDRRQELFCRVRITLVDLSENPGYV